MEEYSILRQFADSWMLLLLFGFFVGVIFWVFRPGSKKQYEDTANIPFRNDEAPIRDEPDDTPAKSNEDQP
ncbi:MAG: cytochrome c oxidase cbb3-type subunit 4 [Paracoccaceae bacterium]|jgi:cytochrome c oxidase cbb3-type subunit 4